MAHADPAPDAAWFEQLEDALASADTLAQARHALTGARTGVLVDVGEGDTVIGATLNQTGAFLMRAEKVGSETLLSQIVQMVANAQRSKAPLPP